MAKESTRIELTDDEIEIFNQARVAGDGLRRSFDQWIVLGHAVVAARAIAVRIGGKRTFHRVLEEQKLEWMHQNGRSSTATLETVMRSLPRVLEWREGLSEKEKISAGLDMARYLQDVSTGTTHRSAPLYF